MVRLRANWLVLMGVCVTAAWAMGGCEAQVHPRVGKGIEAPAWVEVQRPPAPHEQAANEPVGPMRIRARHIVVAYLGAERAVPSIGRTRDQAFLRANEALRRAKSGDDFEGLVAEYSDEPGAAARGGDLGEFSRGQMVQSFSDAAFALQVGQISDVVESPFGFHIIERLK